jgi:hypothetical protein
MHRLLYSFFVVLSFLAFSTSILYAQLDNLRGTDSEFRMGVHSGNEFHTTFFNDGTFGGRVNQPPQVAGEWPINSGHFYLVDGNIFVGSEVIDNSGNLIHILSENKSANIGGSRGDQDPVSGEWWTFLPLSGFANPNEDRVAMARGSVEWSNSWPAFWPDKYDDPSDPGWRNDNVDNDPSKAAWNGFFGKGVFNADEESYFVADDYMNREFDFFPDSTDLTRKGLGIRMYVRGFQWSKTAVEDALFNLFDLENMGTHLHDKMVFGYKIGNNMGETVQGSDAGDDNAAFERDLDLAYMWDNDDIGASGWGPDPVGYMGGAFLESPGNPLDGIDNDNDGELGPGIVISEAMFNRGPLGLYDQIIFINYNDPAFPRILTTLADTLTSLGKPLDDTLIITVGGREYKYWEGKELQEDVSSAGGTITSGTNLFDDNLNGLIDENRGVEIEPGLVSYLYSGYKAVDYFSGTGEDNILLDERRDDGIDNDGDWDPEFDDTGRDGLLPGDRGYPGPDDGERDGQPTPGEPNFDQTDIDESDQLGLTSFNLYEWTSLNQYDDEPYWNAMAPGFFSTNVTGQNVELLFGSGYFPVEPGRIERFSMAIICGTDLTDLIINKNSVALAYNRNYNFSKAPLIPTVRAVADDNRVTLFWDDFAEESEDPITGRDFEGYKIYRSTDSRWSDMKQITNGFGQIVGQEPLAQFDYDNDISGFASEPEQGLQFWLGNNTGLRHYWVDTTAVNGYDYFYAVTSYDRGSDSLGISPTECSKFVRLLSSGEIEKGTNVVVVRPEAPAAGFVPADFEDSEIMQGANNTASGTVNYNIIDPTQFQNNHRYQITFKDTLSADLLKSTGSFTLVDITANDTLLKDNSLEGDPYEGLPITDGFQLLFSDNPVELNLNPDLSGWNKSGIPNYGFRRYIPTPSSRPIDLIVSDFEIQFSDVGIDTSKLYYIGNNNLELPPTPVNFTVINTITNEKVDFAFRERHVASPQDSGIFSFNLRTRRSDEIIFLADPDSLVGSWQVVYLISSASQPDTLLPGPGDYLTLNLDKPFLSHDTYEFTALAAGINPELAKTDLDKIKVVPNPYIVSNSWEPRNPYASGRGDRELHFIHLPAKCTIRIFNVRGQLVDTIEHESQINDGTAIWNMLSQDNLEISYGIYIYHIDADGIGETIGKFIVIK